LRENHADEDYYHACCTYISEVFKFEDMIPPLY